MKKLPLWNERVGHLKESDVPKDPNWEEKLRAELEKIDQQIKESMKPFQST